ncbi:MAG TPA: hypothetical protein VIT00_09465, partial [Terrimicrobiaceae bacterium]
MFGLRERGWLREDRMCIRAAKSEGIHARHTLAIRLREGFGCGRHAELQFFEVDIRIRRIE